MTTKLLFIGGGALVGFGLYQLVGCQTGACPITARWWTSTAYGALMGHLAHMSWLG